jgi:hypothetical protein
VAKINYPHNREPRRDLQGLIRRIVEERRGFVSLGEICHALSTTGAAYNRWTRNDVAGVRAVIVDGVKGFVPAPKLRVL